MAGHGPPPTPKRILEARGSRRGKERPSELEIEAGVPAPPKVLRKHAREEWGRVVPILSEKGVLTIADRAALVEYCEAWAEMRDLEARRDTLDRQMKRMRIPGFSMDQRRIRSAYHEAFARWQRMAERFGLTPADRPRVKTGNKGTTTDGKGRFFQTGEGKPRLVG